PSLRRRYSLRMKPTWPIGKSWENLRRNSPLRKFVRSNAKYGETMSKIYRSSRIVLNFIRKQNGDAHNMRTFEVPACGGFMLATRTKEQTEFFREGEEADFFSSPEELRTKIKYYLSNPDLRTAIAQRGLERVENETYLQRMEKVTKVLESLRS
ncbi:CgeB family protein, partial [Candidatus Hakubella thermalkaliphila]